MKDSGKMTRRDFAYLAAIASISLEMFALDRKPSHDLPRIGVSGADSLRAHAAAVGLQVGCAVRPELLDLGADPANGSPLGSQDPYTLTVIDQAGILVAENSMSAARTAELYIFVSYSSSAFFRLSR